MIKGDLKRYLVIGSRIVLGLIFLIIGIEGLASFIPSSGLDGAIAGYILAVSKTGYFMPFLKVIEITCGLALIVGWYVPLALVILAPIVVQIVLFQVFLDHQGIFMGLLAAILLDYLIWVYRKYYKDLIVRKAKPEIS